MSQGGNSEPLLLLALFYQSTHSCLKVIGGWVVAHKILLSTQSFGFWDWTGLDNKDLLLNPRDRMSPSLVRKLI